MCTLHYNLCWVTEQRDEEQALESRLGGTAPWSARSGKGMNPEPMGERNHPVTWSGKCHVCDYSPSWPIGATRELPVRSKRNWRGTGRTSRQRQRRRQSPRHPGLRPRYCGRGHACRSTGDGRVRAARPMELAGKVHSSMHGGWLSAAAPREDRRGRKQLHICTLRGAAEPPVRGPGRGGTTLPPPHSLCVLTELGRRRGSFKGPGSVLAERARG